MPYQLRISPETRQRGDKIGKSRKYVYCPSSRGAPGYTGYVTAARLGLCLSVCGGKAIDAIAAVA